MILAVLIGDLFLIGGFSLLILPLLVTELSRARDSIWGALIIISGLILITGSDGLGSSIIAFVFCQTLIMTRLFWEVFNQRWNQLSSDEKLGLRSFNKWKTSFKQLFFVVRTMLSVPLEAIKLFSFSKQQNLPAKKWVRPDFSDQNQEKQSIQISKNESQKMKVSSNEDQISSTKQENMSSDDS